MSKNSSPPTRSSRTSPTAARRRPRTQRPDEQARASTVPEAPSTMRERLRHYLPFIGIPNVVIVLGIVVVCLATILLAGGRLAALPASIAETWFVLHGVPVLYDGVILRSIPLLPAILVAAFIAWRVRVATRERVSILDLYAIFGLVVLIPFTLGAIAWFMVADASAVFPVSPPAIHKALFIPVFVHLSGMACGMSVRLWKALAARLSLPASLIDALRATSSLFLHLLTAATAVYLVVLALNYQRIADLIGEFPALTPAGAVGLIAVCVLYLPNAVISTLAVLLGAPFQIADGGVSLFSAALVPLPPLPLSAAIPGEVPAWAPILMAIPAAVVIRFAISRSFTGLGVLASAVFAAFLAAVSGLMSGGIVGAYGWVGPHPGFFALAAFCWVGVTAGAAWAISSLRNSRTPDTEPETDDSADSVEFEEVDDAEVEAEVEEVEEPEQAEQTDDQPSGGSTAISVMKQQGNEKNNKNNDKNSAGDDPKLHD